MGDVPLKTSIHRGFSIAMFDCGRVYPKSKMMFIMTPLSVVAGGFMARCHCTFYHIGLIRLTVSGGRDAIVAGIFADLRS